VIKSFNPLPSSSNPETITLDPSLPTEKKSPKTIVVDQMGQGDYATITEAMDAAKVGYKILVRPGLYEEFLEIDKPIEIIGDGEKADIEIRAAGKHTVAFRAAQGRIANLTLRQIDSGEFNCVDISKGRLILEDCDISGQGNNCIVIRDSADPRLRRNTIHDSKGHGVFITDKGQGILEGNDIFGSNPTLRGNNIHDGKGNGVRIMDNGQGVLEDNDIFGHNEYSQVYIDTGGNPALRRNRIHDAKSNGVQITDNGQGILEENDIFGHDSPQVAITKGGNPILRGNHIHDGKSNAIYIGKDGNGTFENNDLRNNKNGAWYIEGSLSPKVKRVANLE
jgi:parallel beta-helix repeat protein